MAACSSKSFDEAIHNSLDLGHRALLSSVDTPHTPAPTSLLHSGNATAHAAIKPLKKRHLASYVAGPTGENEEVANCVIGGTISTDAAGHIDEHVQSPLIDVGSKTFGEHERRTGIDGSDGSQQKMGNPNMNLAVSRSLQTTIANRSASVNVAQGHLIGERVHLRGSSTRSSDVGLSRPHAKRSSNHVVERSAGKNERNSLPGRGLDGRRSVPDALITETPNGAVPRTASPERVTSDGKLSKSTTRVDPSKSTLPSTTIRQPPFNTGALHLNAISNGKQPEIKLKLKLKRDNKTDEPKSNKTKHLKNVQLSQVQTSQSIIPKAETIFPVLKKKAAWMQSVRRTEHEANADNAKAGTMSDVTPTAENKPPQDFMKPVMENARQNKDRRVYGGGGGSESENKMPNPQVTKVNTTGLLPSTTIVAEGGQQGASTKKWFITEFGEKQKKVIGKKLRYATHRMSSSKKPKRTGQESGEAVSKHAFGKRLEAHRSSSCDGGGGNGYDDDGDDGINITKSGSYSSNSSDRSKDVVEEGNVENSFVYAGGGEANVDMDFSVDDLTYYPAQSGSENEYDGNQHDVSADNGVEHGPVITGPVIGVNVEAEEEEKKKELKTSNVTVHSDDDDKEETKETQQKSCVPYSTIGLDLSRRRRNVKRRRLGKLFVSEDDEDDKDPEFVPSKKLRYAVRRMKAQEQEKQQRQQQQRRSSSGGGKSGREIVNVEDVHMGRDET